MEPPGAGADDSKNARPTLAGLCSLYYPLGDPVSEREPGLTPPQAACYEYKLSEQRATRIPHDGAHRRSYGARLDLGARGHPSLASLDDVGRTDRIVRDGRMACKPGVGWVVVQLHHGGDAPGVAG